MRISSTLLSSLIAICLVSMVWSCALAANHSENDAGIVVDPGADEAKPVTSAIAILYPTKESNVSGSIRFMADQTKQGLSISTDVTGLPPGKHGYHIHLYGDCTSYDGTSAGTHFNFTGSSINPPPNIKRITGNLGNLVADKDGLARSEGQIRNATLQGRYSIIGRSVIIHEKGNNPADPPIGGAGSRLACGVIGIADQ